MAGGLMRVLGIDYGSKRTGLAIADVELRMAMPFTMYEGLGDAQLAEAIVQLVRKEEIQTLVVGYPFNMDGTVGPQAKVTERFIVMLEQATGLKIHRMDERLTSHDSEGKLAGNFTRKQKRQRVDAIAAARILQDWLDMEGK
jgi:putative holliday junction resolvase